MGRSGRDCSPDWDFASGGRRRLQKRGVIDNVLDTDPPIAAISMQSGAR
jgi:hypothetical protein